MKWPLSMQTIWHLTEGNGPTALQMGNEIPWYNVIVLDLTDWGLLMHFWFSELCPHWSKEWLVPLWHWETISQTYHSEDLMKYHTLKGISNFRYLHSRIYFEYFEENSPCYLEQYCSILLWCHASCLYDHHPTNPYQGLPEYIYMAIPGGINTRIISASLVVAPLVAPPLT